MSYVRHVARVGAMPVLLAACVTEAGAIPDDTDTDLDVVAETGDTAEPWIDTDDVVVTDDTFRVTDRPIGATELDGTWTGTFAFTEVFPGTLGEPSCAGTVEIVVDGDAARHVTARFVSTTWDTHPKLGPKYGPLDGIGFATLDPGVLLPVRLDVALGAKHMGTFDAEGIKMRLIDDRLVINFDNVVGLGKLQFGYRLAVSADRSAPPASLTGSQP